MDKDSDVVYNDSSAKAPAKGPPFKRPKGESRPGFKWDTQVGEWYKQKPSASIAKTSTSAAVVVHNSSAASGEGGVVTGGADSLEEADGNALTGIDASHPLGTLDDHVANGRCAAIALTKLGVCPTVEAAVKALNHEMSEAKDFRDDFRQDEKRFGKMGESWHRQIIQRAVLAAGFDYRITPVLEMNTEDSYLVDGLANDRYLQDKTWVEPYERDSPEDNPRDDPLNWQHVVAVVKGKIKRTYKSIDMANLHLDTEGKADPEKGFFIRIDRVYKVSRSGEDEDEGEGEEEEEEEERKRKVAKKVARAVSQLA